MLSEGSDPANPPNQNIRTKFIIKNTVTEKSVHELYLFVHLCVFVRTFYSRNVFNLLSRTQCFPNYRFCTHFHLLSPTRDSERAGPAGWPRLPRCASLAVPWAPRAAPARLPAVRAAVSPGLPAGLCAGLPAVRPPAPVRATFQSPHRHRHGQSQTAGQGRAGQGRTRQGGSGQAGVGQDRAGQDRAGRGRTRQGGSGQVGVGQGRSG